MGFSNVIFEGDALHIVKLINNSAQELSVVGNLIEEAKLATKRFLQCKVENVMREGNLVARFLAKSAILIEEDLYWVFTINEK